MILNLHCEGELAPLVLFPTVFSNSLLFCIFPHIKERTKEEIHHSFSTYTRTKRGREVGGEGKEEQKKRMRKLIKKTEEC
jgi:hypothetical protein